MRISDWSSDVCSSDLYWFNARPGRETFAENVRKTWGAGSPDETPELWKTLSPALNVDRIHAPILMQFPEQEARLSIELVSRLATAGIGETHIFPYSTEERRVGKGGGMTFRSRWSPYH